MKFMNSELGQSMSSEKNSAGPHLLRSGLFSDLCRQARHDLPLDLVNELDNHASVSLYQHLSECSSCRNAYIALNAASSLAGFGSDVSDDHQHGD